jgi:hypothetical protein
VRDCGTSNREGNYQMDKAQRWSEVYLLESRWSVTGEWTQRLGCDCDCAAQQGERMEVVFQARECKDGKERASEDSGLGCYVYVGARNQLKPKMKPTQPTQL